jgi:hypothetical protein
VTTGTAITIAVIVALGMVSILVLAALSIAGNLTRIANAIEDQNDYFGITGNAEEWAGATSERTE